MADRSQLTGLDQDCGVCGRVSGDHTLREWSECLGTTTTDLPYEPVPEDAARVAREQMGLNFGIPDDWLIADNVVAKALVLNGRSGHVDVKVPVLLHEFGVAAAGGMVPVATLAFIGGPDTMRKYGRLVRDNANGAANAAERGTG